MIVCVGWGGGGGGGLVLFETVSLCVPGCPGTHCVDHAVLELRNSPVSASPSAGLKGEHRHAWTGLRHLKLEVDDCKR